MITSEQIEQLATRKGVRKIAVENFLGTLGNEGLHDAMRNMVQDARAYQWNAATQSAIARGIRLHYGAR
jgi:exonuclease III